MQIQREPQKGGAAEAHAILFRVAAKGRHRCVLTLNKKNIVAVTTILVVHVGNGRSEHV